MEQKIAAVNSWVNELNASLSGLYCLSIDLIKKKSTKGSEREKGQRNSQYEDFLRPSSTCLHWIGVCLCAAAAAGHFSSPFSLNLVLLITDTRGGGNLLSLSPQCFVQSSKAWLSERALNELNSRSFWKLFPLVISNDPGKFISHTLRCVGVHSLVVIQFRFVIQLVTLECKS